MKVKIFLHPEGLGLSVMETFSKSIVAILEWRGDTLEKVAWDGRIESLPKDEQVIVRLSPQLSISTKELFAFCKEYKHLVIYDDAVFDLSDTKKKGGWRWKRLIIKFF